MGLFVLAYEVLYSADISQSLKYFSVSQNLSEDIQKSGSILTSWEPLAIHPWVRANRVLKGLGWSFKNRTTDFFYFVPLKMNNTTRHNREILSNQDSIRRLSLQNYLSVCPLLHRGSKL